jgi:hypothetical protein
MITTCVPRHRPGMGRRPRARSQACAHETPREGIVVPTFAHRQDDLPAARPLAAAGAVSASARAAGLGP